MQVYGQKNIEKELGFSRSPHFSALSPQSRLSPLSALSPLSVIIAGGGTGGHVFPGIAIAQEFKRRNSKTQVLFVGTHRGLESRIVPQEGFKLELLEVAALKRVSLMERIKSLMMLPKSMLAARSIIKKNNPDLVIGVGGYASGPVVLVASLMSVPTLVAEQNALPGFTNRMLSRVIDAAAVSFQEAKVYFGAKAEITGNPIRSEFFTLPLKDPGRVLHVLITGGSQGARKINEAIIGTLPLIANEKDRFSFTHQTGEHDYDLVLSAYREYGVSGEVKPFIEQMVAEFARADLVICRAGATTVAELAAAGKPAIMIPFPFAADDHQRKNAEAVENAGAGRMILQAELTPERLAQELLWLIRDPQQLKRMAEASKTLARPQAAASVVDLAMRLCTRNTSTSIL